MGYTMDMSNEKEMVTRELFPEGWRKLRIENVEEKVSSKGNAMLEITLCDIEEEKQDVVYAIMEQGKRWLLKKLLFACAVPIADGEVYTFELSDLEGKIIMGKNKQIDETFIDRKGEEKTMKKNKINDFQPYTRKEDENEEKIPF